MLSREEIFNFKAVIPTEVVDVPEWSGQVKVRGLTAGERDAFEIGMKDARKPNVRAALVARAALSENGARLFTDADADSLAGFDSRPLDRLFAVAARLSGITPDDVDKLEGK